MRTNIGDVFQQETKYRRGHLPGGFLDWARKPAAYKDYPQAPKVRLEAPQTQAGPALWDALRSRRSVRDYQPTAITQADLSQLLWATQGVTETAAGYRLRTAPSAGALYPIETYLVVHSVEALQPGVYHYGVGRHELDLLQQGDFRSAVAGAALDQEMAYTASVVFIWTAVFGRARWKYRERAYRYVYLDAGHIAQNLALAAVGLGLGTCQIGALYDDEVNALVGADGKQESVLYMTTVGRP